MRRTLSIAVALVLTSFVSATPAAVLAAGPPQLPQGRFQPLPASPEPPEIKAQQQEAEQAMKGINQGRLSKQQLRQMLLNHPNARIRDKAQDAQRLKLKPRSGIDSQGAFASLSSLWSLLNPFATTEAQALGSYYSLVLTPQAPQSYNPPLNYLSLSGVFYTSNPGYSTYLLNNIPSTALGSTITKPYAYVFVQLPLAGWYLIDFYGNGKPKVTLRAAAAQYPATLPVLESWDMTASPNSLNHFVTVEPLAQGEHSLLFMIDTGYLYPSYVAVYSF